MNACTELNNALLRWKHYKQLCVCVHTKHSVQQAPGSQNIKLRQCTFNFRINRKLNTFLLGQTLSAFLLQKNLQRFLTVVFFVLKIVKNVSNSFLIHLTATLSYFPDKQVTLALKTFLIQVVYEINFSLYTFLQYEITVTLFLTFKQLFGRRTTQKTSSFLPMSADRGQLL